MTLTHRRAPAGGDGASLRRRDFLRGTGVAALGACVPRPREPAGPTGPTGPASVPTGAAARWPPFSAGVTIDAASGVNVVWPDDMVERLNAARVVVDLAHGAQRTIHDGIAASKAPALISHTGCRALSDLPRCTPDAELRMLADKGGVAGMIFWPYLRTDTQPMAIDLIRHIEHAIQVAGEDHVGLGSDTSVAPVDRAGTFEHDNRAMVADMVDQGIFARGRPADLYMFLPDLNVADRYERIGALLSARGHSDARIAKILGGNFARVLREGWG